MSVELSLETVSWVSCGLYFLASVYIHYSLVFKCKEYKKAFDAKQVEYLKHKPTSCNYWDYGKPKKAEYLELKIGKFMVRAFANFTFLPLLKVLELVAYCIIAILGSILALELFRPWKLWAPVEVSGMFIHKDPNKRI